MWKRTESFTFRGQSVRTIEVTRYDSIYRTGTVRSFERTMRFNRLSRIAALLITLPATVQCASSGKNAAPARGTNPSTGSVTQPSTKEPNANVETMDLEIAAPLSQSGSIDMDRDAPLLNDIQLLSDILSDIVNSESQKVHDLYEQFRSLGLERADPSKNQESTMERMVQLAADLDAQDAVGVMRTFSVMLNLVNSAEVQHRTRQMRAHESVRDSQGGPLPVVEDSMRGTMDALLESGLATKEQIFRQLLQQKVEIVLTAHPTQVQRKSMLRKYSHISDQLATLERPDLSAFEKTHIKMDLQRTVASILGADEIRRLKPTPQQEATGGNAILESVLWDAVPAYLRKLDAQVQLTLGMRLPIDFVPIKFASWIGGDRDGNPNVTPLVTREVVLQQHLRAARLFMRDMYDLLGELNISARFSPALLELAGSIKQSLHIREKYRRVVSHLIKRLVKTARECEMELAKLSSGGHLQHTVVDDLADGWSDVDPITKDEDLMQPLRIMYDSLVSTGYGLVADGKLVDIIRRVASFGISLLPLDIREESGRHTEALDAITRYLGIGSYNEWTEEARLNWLTSELVNRRPLFRIRDLEEMGFEQTVVNTLQTFETAASLSSDSLGAYVISQAQTASDVLAVMLLQKQFGMTADKGNLMRVVPLFETLNDLTNAASVLKTLFSVPVYVGVIRGKQEVMVGYSDSAKDAGRLAACWAQYKSQEDMVNVAAQAGIELTFFHGKGGTVSRGGNPSVYRAIMSAHPPNTINGRFRVTEQGEMITQNFGAQSIAERTLDTYTSAVCREHFTKHVEPKKKWRQQMEKISDNSCEEYRQLVREEPRFVPYFRQATPELELNRLNIGSRPAKRNPMGGIESLRAIPWTFAWTQTRTHLSAWLGVGKGLHAENDEELETLRDMYQKWPWFRETVDLIAMILSKTDYSIAKNYDTQLVDKSEDLKKLGEEVRDKLVETRQAVLDITESKHVAGVHVALTRASNTIRFPFLDPINVCQAEFLKRLRATEKESDDASKKSVEHLQDALMISINGIAQGMRNSG
ncbi:hypothetical protein MPSEU_000835700 [Mayamaea pseudoterrestris]|nr:hypothetical protein MPSEU_000835700 [Mayamaea pseudoterrestris]